MLRAFRRETCLGLASPTEGAETALGAAVTCFVSEGTFAGSDGIVRMQCNFVPLCALSLEPGSLLLSIHCLLKSQSSFRSSFLKPALNLSTNFN